MATRKSMTLPIIISLIFIIIIIWLFMSIKQTEITCSNNVTFDSGVTLKEEVVTEIERKKINRISVTKTIYLPEKYRDKKYVNLVIESLERTLGYLGKKVKYSISEDKIVVRISVKKNEIILLDNIDFSLNGDSFININSNTKSNKVVTLRVGDDYTDGEYMQKMKSEGYTCK